MDLKRDFEFGDGKVRVEIVGDDVTLSVIAEDGTTASARADRGMLGTIAAMLDDPAYGLELVTRDERRAAGIEDDE